MDGKFYGLDGILKELDSIATPAQVEKTLMKACALVERSAKQKAPKGDGVLRNSIKSTVVGDKGIVFTPLEYAPYVEYGTGLFAENGGRQDVPWSYQDWEGNWHTTSGQHPQPFMRPALDENRGEIKRILEEGLTKK